MQTVIDLDALSPIINLAEVLRERLSQRSKAEMFFVVHAQTLTYCISL